MWLLELSGQIANDFEAILLEGLQIFGVSRDTVSRTVRWARTARPGSFSYRSWL